MQSFARINLREGTNFRGLGGGFAMNLGSAEQIDKK